MLELCDPIARHNHVWLQGLSITYLPADTAVATVVERRGDTVWEAVEEDTPFRVVNLRVLKEVVEEYLFESMI